MSRVPRQRLPHQTVTWLCWCCGHRCPICNQPNDLGGHGLCSECSWVAHVRDALGMATEGSTGGRG